jgi:hypothetical protein
MLLRRSSSLWRRSRARFGARYTSNDVRYVKARLRRHPVPRRAASFGSLRADHRRARNSVKLDGNGCGKCRCNTSEPMRCRPALPSVGSFSIRCRHTPPRVGCRRHDVVKKPLLSLALPAYGGVTSRASVVGFETARCALDSAAPTHVGIELGPCRSGVFVHCTALVRPSPLAAPHTPPCGRSPCRFAASVPEFAHHRCSPARSQEPAP